MEHLFSFHEEESGRLRFHGVRAELIRAQAESLRIPILQLPTNPDNFEAMFLEALRLLRRLGVGAVVFGNIHLADVRAWYEERSTALGLEHREPLWGEDSAGLVREFLERGFRTRIVSIRSDAAEARWLGAELDDDLLADVLAHPGIDPAGEGGEFHTFVHAGPLFSKPLRFTAGEESEREGHRVLDLLPLPGG